MSPPGLMTPFITPTMGGKGAMMAAVSGMQSAHDLAGYLNGLNYLSLNLDPSLRQALNEHMAVFAGAVRAGAGLPAPPPPPPEEEAEVSQAAAAAGG
eukprot:7274232-Pyramimonas_sp.AAC.1